MENFPQLRIFFETIRNFSFWQRIFGWGKLLGMTASAWEELTENVSSLKSELAEKKDLAARNQLLELDKSNQSRTIEELRQQVLKLEMQQQASNERQQQEIQHLQLRIKEREDLLRQREDALLRVKEGERQRNDQYQAQVQKAMSIQEIFEKEKALLHERELKKVHELQEKLKLTWAEHQNTVEQTIRRICNQKGLEYVTEFPFRGKPDNAVRIAGEIVVFDAKSPASDDLGNFKNYIRTQSEQAKKYAGQDNVRKDVYMVIPNNAAEVLDTFSFDKGDYRVYVITLDALEPVLITLQQIESYEFVEQLSPEERQSICRIIGSLIYASKRRIQVDQYFNGHLLELIGRVQRELPESMTSEIAQTEQAMKLNPTNDRRSKAISMESLEKSHQQHEAQAGALEAPTPRNIEIKG